MATVLIEGGARILRDALAGGLADELRLAIAPFFVADPAAPRFALPAAYPHTAANPMTLTSLRQVGEVAVHHYRLATAARAHPPVRPGPRARPLFWATGPTVASTVSLGGHGPL